MQHCMPILPFCFPVRRSLNRADQSAIKPAQPMYDTVNTAGNVSVVDVSQNPAYGMTKSQV